VRFRLAADPDAALDALDTLAQEMARAGARVLGGRGAENRVLDLILPPGLGESSICIPLSAERAR
jgi:hypothetical protein